VNAESLRMLCAKRILKNKGKKHPKGIKSSIN